MLAKTSTNSNPSLSDAFLEQHMCLLPKDFICLRLHYLSRDLRAEDRALEKNLLQFMRQDPKLTRGNNSKKIRIYRPKVASTWSSSADKNVDFVFMIDGDQEELESIFSEIKAVEQTELVRYKRRQYCFLISAPSNLMLWFMAGTLQFLQIHTVRMAAFVRFVETFPLISLVFSLIGAVMVCHSVFSTREQVATLYRRGQDKLFEIADLNRGLGEKLESAARKLNETEAALDKKVADNMSLVAFKAAVFCNVITSVINCHAFVAGSPGSPAKQLTKLCVTRLKGLLHSLREVAEGKQKVHKVREQLEEFIKECAGIEKPKKAKETDEEVLERAFAILLGEGPSDVSLVAEGKLLEEYCKQELGGMTGAIKAFSTHVDPDALKVLGCAPLLKNLRDACSKAPQEKSDHYDPAKRAVQLAHHLDYVAALAYLLYVIEGEERYKEGVDSKRVHVDRILNNLKSQINALQETAGEADPDYAKYIVAEKDIEQQVQQLYRILKRQRTRKDALDPSLRPIVKLLLAEDPQAGNEGASNVPAKAKSKLDIQASKDLSDGDDISPGEEDRAGTSKAKGKKGKKGKKGRKNTRDIQDFSDDGDISQCEKDRAGTSASAGRRSSSLPSTTQPVAEDDQAGNNGMRGPRLYRYGAKKVFDAFDDSLLQCEKALTAHEEVARMLLSLQSRTKRFSRFEAAAWLGVQLVFTSVQFFWGMSMYVDCLGLKTIHHVCGMSLDFSGTGDTTGLILALLLCVITVVRFFVLNHQKMELDQKLHATTMDEEQKALIKRQSDQCYTPEHIIAQVCAICCGVTLMMCGRALVAMESAGLVFISAVYPGSSLGNLGNAPVGFVLRVVGFLVLYGVTCVSVLSHSKGEMETPSFSNFHQGENLEPTYRIKEIHRAPVSAAAGVIAAS